jgi:hypothetical protein
MSGRRVSREPYRVRRDPREVMVAIAVAMAIVLGTVVAVWIFAPNDDSSPSDNSNPAITLPSTSATTAPAADTTPTTAPSGG